MLVYSSGEPGRQSEKRAGEEGIQYDILDGFFSGLGKMKELPVDFSEKLFCRLVDYTTVYSNGRGRLPQRCGSRDGDLRPEAVEASGLSQMLGRFICV